MKTFPNGSGRWSALGILALAVGGCLPSPEGNARDGATGATVELIGHASVVIEGPDGSRVLMDPFNGVKWMGYHFPDSVDSDAIVISHPHYDHDADWEVDGSPSAWKVPGEHRVGSLHIRGVEGEHAGAARFRARGAEPHNVVWTVETGGVRLAHTGDNALPDSALLAAVGPIDVLFTHPFFPASEVAEAWASSGVAVIVPVHTNQPGATVPTFRLPSAQQWLDADSIPPASIQRWDTPRAHFLPDAGNATLQFHLLTPRYPLRKWRPELAQAWQLSAQALELDASDRATAALDLHERAARLAPEAATLQMRWAQALVEGGQRGQALRHLDGMLATGVARDTEHVLRARALLAELLWQDGDTVRAAELFEQVLAEPRTYASDAVMSARNARR